MKPLVLTSVVLLSLTTSTFAANLLVNSGFEDPITYDGAPFVGSWEGFNGGGATAANSTLFPRTGAQSLGLSINNTVNTFAGAFQDVPGLAPGMSFSLDGWHATTSNPLSLGVEIRIEWRNSISNSEVSRTANLTPVPGASYLAFNLSGLVPAGADTARVVYAIQSFSTSPLGNGTVYVDDMSFTTVVPEPTSMALLGLGGLALAVARRRKA
ncbi:MAG: PEP-CTERM sorting domain-containing protein [Verrucomicrobiota bacterium]